ncbi:DUF523 domain-containing protein [Marinifilum caeruleilacunae]|uniref:DUF523 domain-containing protein n=1 Tax=Marinifilum caeruleilacunae TaxID=2499076 RepID=A0ABX1WVT2_9BACT|nr:DUF523 domain-containing protein [Marinifilum caeruleilacunae]NOU60204.1 DUF523 domain-containing protein [Marinifilum caeruleilacunae]
MIIVSSCLAGINCRYDGNNNLVPEIKELVLAGKAIPLCPEELGGLETPRTSCEIVRKGNQIFVISKEQLDCTAQFELGAQKVAEIAKTLNCKQAILKANSPSCGYGIIYDGSFTGKKIEGNGLTADKLAKQGVQIKNEINYKE